MAKTLIKAVESYFNLKQFEIKIVKEYHENYKGFINKKNESFKLSVMIPKTLQYNRIQNYCDLLITNFEMVEEYESK